MDLPIRRKTPPLDVTNEATALQARECAEELWGAILLFVRLQQECSKGSRQYRLAGVILRVLAEATLHADAVFWKLFKLKRK